MSCCLRKPLSRTSMNLMWTISLAVIPAFRRRSLKEGSCRSPEWDFDPFVSRFFFRMASLTGLLGQVLGFALSYCALCLEALSIFNMIFMLKGQSYIFRYPRGFTRVLFCLSASVSFLVECTLIPYQLLIIIYQVFFLSRGTTIRRNTRFWNLSFAMVIRISTRFFRHSKQGYSSSVARVTSISTRWYDMVSFVHLCQSHTVPHNVTFPF